MKRLTLYSTSIIIGRSSSGFVSVLLGAFLVEELFLSGFPLFLENQNQEKWGSPPQIRRFNREKNSGTLRISFLRKQNREIKKQIRKFRM